MEQSKRIIVNLRGTSGSGKTTIVRHILSQGTWKKWTDEKGKVLAYYNEEKMWAIIGSYENVCGGCDTIRTQDEIGERIRLFANTGYNVLFEGLLTSTLSSRWEKFSKEIVPIANMLFWYVNTPIEECLCRIEARRAARGTKTPLNPKNTVERVKAIEVTYQKLSAAGCYCLKASQEEIIQNMKDWFGLGNV